MSVEGTPRDSVLPLADARGSGSVPSRGREGAELPVKALADGLALVFDVDGVIVDSNLVHTTAWEKYLERCGIRANGIYKRMQGKHNDEIVRDLFGELSPGEVASHGAAKERLYRELMAVQLCDRLVPGVRRFLDRRRETPMAVASNAEPLNVDFVLGGAGLRKYFRAVISSAQVSRPKPDPEVYRRAAELLGTPASNCIVFEDSAVGVRAARGAGARVVVVRTANPAPAGADLDIGDFTDPKLERWLDSQEAK